MLAINRCLLCADFRLLFVVCVCFVIGVSCLLSGVLVFGGYWLLFVLCYLVCVVCGVLLVACCLFVFVVCGRFVVVCCRLCVVYCLLFVVSCLSLLFVVWRCFVIA